MTPEAWLSTWSGLSSRANLMRNLPKVTVPTLVVGAMADQDIFVSDAHAEFAASGAADKQLEFIEGADHFMRAGGSRGASRRPASAADEGAERMDARTLRAVKGARVRIDIRRDARQRFDGRSARVREKSLTSASGRLIS